MRWAGGRQTAGVVDSGQFQRALVVVAHPHDAEIAAGGTIAAWAGAGIEVGYCVLTSGGAAGFDPPVSVREAAEIRQAEQRVAAGALGVARVDFRDHPAGALAPTGELRRDVARAIREFRPDRLVTWSPEWNWARFRGNHPDHLATGAAVLAAIHPDADDPFVHPDLQDEYGLAPWAVAEIWLVNSRQPNHYVDITGTAEQKVAAAAAHHSRHGRDPDLAGDLRAGAAADAAAAGLASGRLAEGFLVVANR